MGSELEQNIINDFYKYLSIDEMAEKYKEYGTTTYVIKKIIKDNNLTRKQSCKMLKILGDKSIKPNKPFIPIDKVYKTSYDNKPKIIQEKQVIQLKADDEIIYDNRKVKQRMPKNTKIDVIQNDKNIKQDEEMETINTELYDKIMGSSKKTLEKIKNKK